MEYQYAFLIRENRQIVRCRIGLLGLFLRMSKAPQAWYYLEPYLHQVTGFGSRYWEFIYERFAMPVSPYQGGYFGSEDAVKEIIDQDKVAEAAANFTTAESEIQIKKTRYWDFLGLAAMGMVFIFIVIALLVASGKVNIGQIMSGFTGGSGG